MDSKGTYSVSPKGSDITLDATTYVGSAIENGKAYVTIAVVANTTRTSYYDTEATLTIVYSTADVVKYSVKFVDKDGNELKPSLTNQEGLAGENVEILNEWKASITKDDVKYVYDSNVAPATYSEGAVITIKFREAAKYNYSVTTNQSTEITSGSDYEGTNISYAYNKFILKGTELFESARQGSNPWWGSSFVLDSDNKNIVINYTKAKDDVVFYSEAEDLAGASKATGSNAEIRCSNKAGGYAGGDVTVTTLSAGKYRLYTSVWGNAGKTVNFKAGEDLLGAFDTKGYIQDYNTEEFVLTSETTITFSGTDSAHPVDFVYIVKTGDYTGETITVTDRATYVTSAALDFTGLDVKAYVASAVTESSVTLTQVNKVAANEPIVLLAEGEVTVDVPTFAGAADTYTNNFVQAAEATEARTAGKTIYAISKTYGDFRKVGTSVVLPEGKAYLAVDGAAAIKAVVFDDDATAADVVEAQEDATPANGKFIMNGKLVIVKDGIIYNVAGMKK